MQELQQQLGALSVTAADKYDPARAIQELRRISAELEALGDKVVSTRKTHTFLNALPDQQYGQFKAALVCEQSRDDNSDLNLDFERVAHRATAFHSLQIRGKDTTNDDGSGSHGRALNTTVHGGAREFRKHGGRGRNRRGNGGRNADGNNSSNGNSSSGGTTRTGTHQEDVALEAPKVHAEKIAATKTPVEVEDGVSRMAKTARDAAGTATIRPSTSGKTALFASRMRRRTPKNRRTYRRNPPPLRHGSRRSREVERV